MDFASIDFIEQSHHDERIKDNGEMLCRTSRQRLTTTRFNVQYPIAWKETEENKFKIPQNLMNFLLLTNKQ